MKRGFTLLELLVVITIIGLLASVGLASYGRAQARARDARRQSDLTTLRNSLEIYYAEMNQYPEGDWQDVDIVLKDDLVPTYIRVIPSDPGGAGSVAYRYRSVSSGQGYCIAGNLETAEETESTCTVSLEPGYNYGVGNP